MTQNPVVIVGNGGAAVECCRALREQGDRREIHVFAEGEHPVYNPMLTSYYAADKCDYSLLFPYGEGNIFERYGAVLHRSEPVRTLSAAKGLARTAGVEYPFSDCLIASGASVFVPPIPGHDLDCVYTMRTVEDAVRLHDAMEQKPRRAVVVGASMVGIKLVELLYKAGVEVCLADMAEHIFPLAAHPDCSGVIEQRLTERGVRLRFSAAIERIEPAADGGALTWFRGSDAPEPADMVLLSIGVRANTGFLDRDEIACAQGVLVDRRMRTSAAHVYAAGDVAQGYNLLTGEQQIIGLWANARNQGYTAGCNMAGVRREYAGEILHNITHFMGMDFIGLGDVAQYDRCEVLQEADRYAALYYRGGKLTGANFLDDYFACGAVKNSMIKSLLQTVPVESRHGLPVQEYLLRTLEGRVRAGSAV